MNMPMDSTVATAWGKEMPGFIRSYNPDGDMSTLTNTFVELDTTRVRTVKAYAGGVCVGILTNAPTETATSTNFSTIAKVQQQGVALIIAGSGGLAVGDWVKPTTGGVGIKANPADGDMVYGQVEVAAAEGYPAAMRFDRYPAVSVPAEE